MKSRGWEPIKGGDGANRGGGFEEGLGFFSQRSFVPLAMTSGRVTGSRGQQSVVVGIDSLGLSGKPGRGALGSMGRLFISYFGRVADRVYYIENR